MKLQNIVLTIITNEISVNRLERKFENTVDCKGLILELILELEN